MFPKDFLWGAATAAYQIEGAVKEDGRGESIWDRFSHTPGKVDNGDVGDVACDHYHRYGDDVALMKTLGLKAYRFSIAWPRVFPTGKYQVNEAGLGFYDSLIDKILEAGIIPFPTLYHWDLPQTLQDQGGWLNRDTSDYLAQYADTVTRAFGDRVKHWVTFNEMAVSAYHGYQIGVHAPGLVDPTYKSAFTAAHHMLLAHGKAVPIIRRNVADAQVGIVHALSPIHAATDSEADKAAAWRVDGTGFRWYLDPVFKGTYPVDVIEALGNNAPPVRSGDMEVISAPLDMFGVNYYFRQVVEDDQSSSDMTKARVVMPPAAKCTDMGWEIYSDGLRELLVRIHNEYHPKALYVTESGCAMVDVVQDGKVHDNSRIAYLHDHFNAAAEAIAQGAPVKGYFVWSMFDNFEWAYGYAKRFGITYIDYATQQRIPKDSYYFYQKVIADNALPQA